MEPVSKLLEDMLIEIYEEQVFMLKTSKSLKSRDVQNLLNKTVLIDNFDELYRTLKTIADSPQIGGDHDAFLCWTLYQSVAYLISIRFDFLKLLEDSRPWPFPDIPSMFKHFFENFMLGIVNEMLDENHKNLSEYHNKKTFNKPYERIKKMTKRAYFDTDFNRKIAIAQKISDWQFEYYRSVNHKLKKLSEDHVRDPFEYGWTVEDLEKFYVDTVIFSQKIQITISLLNRGKAIYLGGM
jgi:hypothetical protein